MRPRRPSATVPPCHPSTVPRAPRPRWGIAYHFRLLGRIRLVRGRGRTEPSNFLPTANLTMKLTVATACISAAAAALLPASGVAVAANGGDDDRALMASMPGHNMYGALQCNVDATPAIDSTDCLASAATLSHLLMMAGDSTSEHPLTIPCGSCATVDITDGRTVTLPKGLNVVGRLHFPPSANVVLNTTAVFVQGLLGMEPPAAGNKVKITMYGTEDVTFYPHDKCCVAGGMDGMMGHRALSTCDPDCADAKNLSKKPIVVAGGKVDIQAIDPSCPSWTLLKDTVNLPPPEPEATCDADGNLIEGDGTFEAADASLSPSFIKGWGSSTMSIETDDDDGNSYLHQTDRQFGGTGFKINLNAPCAVNNRDYKFSLRYRITAGPNWDATKTIPADQWIGMISVQSLETGWNHEHIMQHCKNLVEEEGEWSGVCTGTIPWSEKRHDATSAIINFQPAGWGDEYKDLDLAFDDISFKLGPPRTRVDAFVVGTDFAKCVKPGEEIMIASAGVGDWGGETVFTVQSVDEAAGTVSFEGSLDQSFPTLASAEPEYAVEVARLNRDVVFEAQDDDPDSLIGGHFIVLHTSGVAQTLSGVEIRNFGQQGRLGRYPIHFHMCDSVDGSVVSKNVVRQSNQRCVVIHGTHDVSVEDNVAYDAHGHCFILEDGGETGNTFAGNLGARTQSITDEARDIGTTDNFASMFWVTNVHNNFVGNVAAGSQAGGFWFETRNEVSGPSRANDDSKPRFMSLEGYEFKDNVAHSNGHNGVQLYSPGWQPDKLSFLEGLKSYKNGHSGLFMHGNRNVVIDGGLFADNRVSCISYLAHDAATNYVKNSVCVGLSRDAETRLGDACRNGIIWSYNEHPWAMLDLDNVGFTGFENQGCDSSQALAMNVPDRAPNTFHGTLHATGMVFENDASKPDIKCSLALPFNDKLDEYPPNDFFLEDIDGTQGSPNGTPGFLVQKDQPHMVAFLGGVGLPIDRHDSCAVFYENVCLRRVHVSHGAYEEGDTPLKLVVTNLDTQTSFAFDPAHSTGNFEPVLPAGTYYAEFQNAQGLHVYPPDITIFFRSAPLCTDYVTEATIDVATPPTHSPTFAPSAAPIANFDSSGALAGDGSFELGTTFGFVSFAGGSEMTIAPDEADASNQILKQTNRAGFRTAILSEILTSRIDEGSVYRFNVRYRFHGDGPNGEGSRIIGMLSWIKPDESWGNEHILFCNDLVPANVWSSCSGDVTMNADKASATYMRITFELREDYGAPYFDVDYDDLSFKSLGPPTMSPTASPIVTPASSGALQGDGSFDNGRTVGFNSHHGGQVSVVQGDGIDSSNMILTQTARPRHFAGINTPFEVSRLEIGATHEYKFRHRPHGGGPNGEGSTVIGMVSWKRPDATWGHQHVLFCFDPVFANEWAECSGSFMMDEDKGSATFMQISFGYRENYGDPWFDVDYDDFSFRSLGPPTMAPTMAPIASFATSGCMEGDGSFALERTSGFNTYIGGSQMSFGNDETDGSNVIMTQTARTDYRTGLNVQLKTSCLEGGAKYRFGFKHRPHGMGPAGEGSTIIGMISWKRADNSWGHQHQIFCFNPVLANDWSECNSKDILIDDDKGSAVHMEMKWQYRENYGTVDGTSHYFDVDYDAISFFKVV